MVLGPHPLDEDDLRDDIVEMVLRRHIGEERARRVCDEVMQELDKYEIFKLERMVA